MTAQNQFEPGDATKAHQQAALLAALREGPISTVHAREVLGIMHPGGRVLELRRSGHAIVTLRRRVVDAEGRAHTSAAYVLTEGGAA